MPTPSTACITVSPIARGLFHPPSLLEPLRKRFWDFGEVLEWKPMRTMGQIMIRYAHPGQAMRAQEEMHKSTFLDRELNVYPAGPEDFTPVLVEREKKEIIRLVPSISGGFLAVPAQTHIWLISPPSSPPLGWEQIRESAPNTLTHAHDLLDELNLGLLAPRPLRPGQPHLPTCLEDSFKSNETAKAPPLLSYLPSHTVQVKDTRLQCPAIAVENWDEDDETGVAVDEALRVFGERVRQRQRTPVPGELGEMSGRIRAPGLPIPKTALPPF